MPLRKELWEHEVDTVSWILTRFTKSQLVELEATPKSCNSPKPLLTIQK